MLQKSLQEDVDPPGEGQHIVMAVGSRGSNIMEVQFPDGKRTLCLIPARFHKKLWIKRGNYLIIENAEETDAAVTGQVVHVLFADHVKQLKKIQGVWPIEFAESNSISKNSSAANLESADSAAAELEQLSIHGGTKQTSSGNGGDETQVPGEREGSEDSYSSSDDDLPPIVQIQNRRVVDYQVSDSESEEEEENNEEEKDDEEAATATATAAVV